MTARFRAALRAFMHNYKKIQSNALETMYVMVEYDDRSRREE